MDDPHTEAGTLPRGPDTRGGRAVVVGYDESPEATTALSWAASQAAIRGLQLRVVYAANPPVPLPWTSGTLLPSTSVLQHSAAKVARRGAEQVTHDHPGLEVRSQGAVGSPAAELVMHSETAAFVVVGRRALTGPLTSLGSVSFALSTHARCPVVVVQGAIPREVGPEHPVVVGVDASRSSLRALEFGAAAADAAGADLVIVSAWSSPEREPWMGDLWAEPARAADLLAAEYESAASCIRMAVALANEVRPQLNTVARTPEGRPAEALLAESGRAGLLVVGSRGHGGFAGLTLGSVSRAILRQAELPVAVVRDGAI
jgi:nucleotide-binding universal stress UspA family protein